MRFVGVDYFGAETSDSSLKGVCVHMGTSKIRFRLWFDRLTTNVTY